MCDFNLIPSASHYEHISINLQLTTVADMSAASLSDADRELLANLKQDERNAKQNNESQATKEHLAGNPSTQ